MSGQKCLKNFGFDCTKVAVTANNPALRQTFESQIGIVAKAGVPVVNSFVLQHVLLYS